MFKKRSIFTQNMKNMKSYLLLVLALFFVTGSAFAQKKEKKTVVTIETTIDENGNEVTTKTVKEVDGDVLEVNEKKSKNNTVIMQKGGSKTIKIHVNDDDVEKKRISTTAKKEVSVDVEEKDGTKKINIKITNEDGEVEIINWEGDGDIPEDIKKELEKRDIDVEMLTDETEGESAISKKERTVTVTTEDIEENNVLLLNSININIESNPAGKKINLTFNGKSAPTSVSLTDETGKQVFHSFMKDFKGKFDEEIMIKGATNETLELRIKQGHKAFVELLK